MQQVAQPWVILSLSHSSFLVGLDSFALNAPGLIFTLWGGVLADRRDRKKVILLFQSIQLLCVAVLLVLLVTGKLQVWMMILISFIIGTTDSLSMPSFQSIIPSLVTPQEIPRAVALNSTQFNLSRMLGPAIAGLMMAQLGAVACFSMNTLSYLPFFISLFWIYPKAVKGAKKNSAEVQEATHPRDFKKLLLEKEVRGPLLTVFATSLLCGPLMTFCPVLIKDVFHADVGEFGGIMSAFGLGGLIGAAISLAPQPQNLKRSRLASLVAIFLGIVILAISLNRSLMLLIVLMVFAGLAITVSNISVNSYLQENANNHNRGKIVSLYQLALQGGISAGGLLTGFTTSQFGVAQALMMNGALAVGVQGLLLWSGRPRPLS